MSKTLTEIAQELKDANKKVQLIYAFNGVGKTRLSREFKELIAPKFEGGEESEDRRAKILYYNAYTEDLFYWDNDLEDDSERKLKIQPNAYTQWVLQEQGKDQEAIGHFQRYTNEKLTPKFNEDFSEVIFSYERGNSEEMIDHIKISKGEESNFIWSIFYSLIEQVIDVLNVVESEERETDQFDQLEYIFIDDPVSSLDENHLIELSVDLAHLIKTSESGVKFIITTHNPLFYNVLHNEFRDDKKQRYAKYQMKRLDDGTYKLTKQGNDSPFSYHLYLKSELEKAIGSGQLHKYHFNFLRNILEKTSTFLGYTNWGSLLPRIVDGNPKPYETRIINISSHSKHAGEEVADLTEDDKRVLRYLVKKFHKEYLFFPPESR